MSNTRVHLSDAPQLQAAVEGLLAIPTCVTPGCHDETEPFTDLCPDCLTGPNQTEATP